MDLYSPCQNPTATSTDVLEAGEMWIQPNEPPVALCSESASYRLTCS